MSSQVRTSRMSPAESVLSMHCRTGPPATASNLLHSGSEMQWWHWPHMAAMMRALNAALSSSLKPSRSSLMQTLSRSQRAVATTASISHHLLNCGAHRHHGRSAAARITATSTTGLTRSELHMPANSAITNNSSNLSKLCRDRSPNQLGHATAMHTFAADAALNKSQQVHLRHVSRSWYYAHNGLGQLK